MALTDADLLRTLMLAASLDMDLANARFRSHTVAEWTELVRRGATATDTAIFVLADETGPTPIGAGLLWCHRRRSRSAVDLGWWWLHPQLEASAAEDALYARADEWAAQQGARHLVSATDDPREAASLQRAGFSPSGRAADGIRTVYARPCGL